MRSAFRSGNGKAIWQASRSSSAIERYGIPALVTSASDRSADSFQDESGYFEKNVDGSERTRQAIHRLLAQPTGGLLRYQFPL